MTCRYEGSCRSIRMETYRSQAMSLSRECREISCYRCTSNARGSLPRRTRASWQDARHSVGYSDQISVDPPIPPYVLFCLFFFVFFVNRTGHPYPSGAGNHPVVRPWFVMSLDVTFSHTHNITSHTRIVSSYNSFPTSRELLR